MPSPVALFDEPKSTKLNVYAETVASFGKIDVFARVP
jgi:hypothetical protein